MIKFLRYLSVGILCTIMAACGSDGGGVGGGSAGTGQTQFSKSITFAELQDTLAGSQARVEIKLLPDSLTAKEVEVKGQDELAKREKIESRIMAISTDGETGTITLELGGLEIGFSAAGTEFEKEDSSSAGDNEISFAEFVSMIQEALDAGDHPAVEAKRNPPDEPQAPDDSTFFATKLELDDEADDPKIEINIDEDNILSNATPPPDGFIQVLGLTIEVGANTELEEELEDIEGEQRFEGIVQSVDLDANSFTLTDGTVIRIVEGTEIEDNSMDDDQLFSLSAVADALAAGEIVEAEGEGIVESSDPLTIIAIEVEFEVEEEAEELAGAMEFENQVISADVAGNTFTLADGTIVSMTAETTIDPEGDLFTLQDVADAITSGEDVRAEGDATVGSAGPPLMLEAIEVKFEVDED